MIRTPSTWRRIGTGLAVVLLASAVQAGTGSVSFQAQYLDQLTNWTHDFVLPKFDPTLGALSAVTLSFDGEFVATFSATNMDAQPQSIDVTVGGTLTLQCPNGSGNCNGGGSALFQVMPSQTFPYPNVPVGATVSDTLSADPPASVLSIPTGGITLTLADFIGPGSLTFQGAAQGGSVVVGPGNISSSITTRASVVLTVTYVYETKEGPCLDNTRDTPGSLLLFPRFDSRVGKTTVITVTNTNCSFLPLPGGLFQGTVDVEFVYVGRYGPDGQDLPCLENNLTVRLSPCDTFTTIARFHDTAHERGFLYVFAKSPSTGQAIVFNYLVGQTLFLSAALADGDGARDALNARTFLGIGSSTGIPQVTGTPTDLDGDGVRDLDGREYSPAPDKILIPRFLGQDANTQDLFRSTLTLVNLSGGSLFDAIVYIQIFDDSENPSSVSHAFRCWDEQRLINLGGPGQGGAFLNTTLCDSSTTDNEILGAPGTCANYTLRKAGWFTIDGVLASSGQDQVNDPVIYAVLCERVGNYEVCDLPWELCTDPRGDLYEFGFLFDEDPPNPPTAP